MVAATGHTIMAMNQQLQYEIGTILEQREILRNNFAKQAKQNPEALIYTPIPLVVPKTTTTETTKPVRNKSRRNRYNSYHGG